MNTPTTAPTQPIDSAAIRSLPPAAVALWQTLTRFCNDAGKVREKLSALAGEMHVSEKTVSRATKALCRAGVVRSPITQGQVKTWTIVQKYNA